MLRKINGTHNNEQRACSFHKNTFIFAQRGKSARPLYLSRGHAKMIALVVVMVSARVFGEDMFGVIPIDVWIQTAK